MGERAEKEGENMTKRGKTDRKKVTMNTRQKEEGREADNDRLDNVRGGLRGEENCINGLN